ncbi:fungal-specific transcription factor domain-containing protein [Lipomyces doorenjongii]|uniref:fungal-specific transcription factor domain-containing protein n=1 Tax=Lipomyces doorenjongii TaxID=383834 RepID=UPI0034CF86B7
MPHSQAHDNGSSCSGIAQRATRRTRAVISCNECHRRKQKCDRQQPCNQCIGRKVQNLCLYTTGSSSPRLAAAAQTAATTAEIPFASSSNSSPDTHVCSSPSKTEFLLNADSASSVSCSRKRGLVSDNSVRENNNVIEYSFNENSDSPVENDSDSEDDVCDALGYFKCGVSNIAQDIAELKLTNSPTHSATKVRKSKIACRSSKIVSRILRIMPPRPYVELMVKIFFSDANFYQTLNESAFWDSLRQWWELPDRAGSIAMPMLTFRLMSIAIQFVPMEHLATLRQIDHSLETLSKDYSQAASELAELLPDCIDRVLEGLLRGVWLKYESRMKESWYCLATVVRMAQEIKLHIEEPNSALSYERERRRRLWWTIYHWDRCMGLLLGRPTMIVDNLCNVPLPLDLPDECYYPVVTPAPAVTEFTGRVLAFKLAVVISDLDTDPLHLYRNVTVYTASLPAYFALYAPDTSLDEQYPFLVAHRESVATTICMILCALYRRKVPVPNPLSFCLRLLNAADRLLAFSKEHQYRQFMIAYQNLEPAVLICREILKMSGSLAESGFVMCDDKSGNIIDVWQCLEAVECALARLRLVRTRNKVADKAYRILKELLRRVKVQVEKERIMYAQLEHAHKANSPPEENVVDREIKKLRIVESMPGLPNIANSNETTATGADAPDDFSLFPAPRENNQQPSENVELANLTDFEESVDASVLKIMQRFDVNTLVREKANSIMTPASPPETVTNASPELTFDELPPLVSQHPYHQVDRQTQPVEQQILDQYGNSAVQIDNGEQMLFSWADDMEIENFDLSAIGEQMDFGMF